MDITPVFLRALADVIRVHADHEFPDGLSHNMARKLNLARDLHDTATALEASQNGTTS